MYCYFLTFRNISVTPELLASESLRKIEQLLCEVPDLNEVRIHTPASASDPMLDDGSPPVLALQLFFREIHWLESALTMNGPVHALADLAEIQALGDDTADQQAMLTRRFPVTDPVVPPDGPRPQCCTYLVRYEGPAQDTNLWLSDYLSGHPPLMRRLPGIRLLEIYTRIDWCGSLPWPRSDDLQRNQVVFDSPGALDIALNSPLRSEMRAHFNALPPFQGSVTHFPMTTRTRVLE